MYYANDPDLFNTFAFILGLGFSSVSLMILTGRG